MDRLDGSSAAIFVDDGSAGGRAALLEAKARNDPRYRYLGPRRNSGREIAIIAGFDTPPARQALRPAGPLETRQSA